MKPLPSTSDCQLRTQATSNQGPPRHDRPDMQTTPYYHPFSNPSGAAMMVTHHSEIPMQSLCKTDQITHLLGGLKLELNTSDLLNFSIAVEHKRLDHYVTSIPENIFQCKDSWHKSSVWIWLPLDKKKMLESKAAEFKIGGVFHHDIINMISTVYQSNTVWFFTHIPFKEYWRPLNDALPKHLYEEVFSS